MGALLITGLTDLHAQLNVDLQVSRRQFIAHEAIPVSVRLTNRAGKELFLHGDGRRPWLDFVVVDKRGTPMRPLGGVLNFQAAKVPVGRSVAKNIDLASVFALESYGNYTVYAVVTLPTGESFQSARNSFTVTKGRTIYEQRVGLGKKARDYRLITFAPANKSYLYFQAELVDQGRVAITYPIGEILVFRKPQATVDKAGDLHALYLAAPDRYMHIRIDSQGRLAEKKIYKRGAVGDPRLVAFADGEVQVAGGILHDAKKQAAQRAKIRKISERPSALFN
ncbi:MAG: hypothetical protein AAGC74_03860 [Verrucomicrobiota bacterium]